MSFVFAPAAWSFSLWKRTWNCIPTRNWFHYLSTGWVHRLDVGSFFSPLCAKSFLTSHSERLQFTNILSRRFWRKINSCHLVSQSELWWCHCFERQHHSILLFLSAENKFRQLWAKFVRVLDRCRRTKDQAVHVSSAHLRSVSCVHKYCACRLKAQTREG